jgi:glyoxylase-like metal-dependent hydrolase (beta-lactamase superfamily II)
MLQTRIIPIKHSTLLTEQFGPVPVIVYVIQDGGRNIIVDTGASDPLHSKKFHYPMIQLEEENFNNSLGKIGLSSKDIDLVILTHLHWDHTYNNELFINAKILVQRSELQYAISPAPKHWIYYEPPEAGFHPPYLKNVRNLKTISGDYQVSKNISLIHTPGHSPGSQCVLVRIYKHKYLIAGDLVERYGDWNSDPMNTSSVIHNIEDYYASLNRVKDLCDFVLPGHDNEVFKQDYYS